MLDIPTPQKLDAKNRRHGPTLAAGVFYDLALLLSAVVAMTIRVEWLGFWFMEGALFGACVGAAIFVVFPKHGIAVVSFYSWLGSCGFSGLGIIFGLLALVTRQGRSRLTALGLFLSGIPLVYFFAVMD